MPTKPSSEWTLDDARANAQSRFASLGRGAIGRRRDYVVRHDHWRNGAEWLGSISDPVLRSRVTAAVAPQFVAVDTLAEGLDNAVNALFATEPSLTLVPLDPAEEDTPRAEEQAEEADRLRGILSAWWDRVGLWQRTADAWRYSLWSTRGTLRLRIPPALMGRDGDEPVLPSGLALEDALRRLYLTAPDPEVAAVHVDPDTLVETAILLYSFDNGAAEESRAELWIREADAETITVRVVGAAEDQRYELRVPALPIHEVGVPLLVTDPVLSQQNRQNYTETVLVRVVETSGFPERYVLDAQEPPLWLPTAPSDGRLVETQIREGVTYYRYHEPVELGPAVVAWLAGIDYGLEESPQRTAPGVTFRDPTDPEYVTKVCDYARSTVLRSMKQGHLAYTSGAQLSGVAYEQARATFAQMLTRSKGDVEGLIRDTVEAAILWAEAMGNGGPSILDEYRINVNLTVHAGPILADQQQATIALYEAGLRSRATAMAETGIEDGDAEEQALDAEPRQRAAELERLAAIVAALARETSLAAVARSLEAAGFPPEITRALLPVDTDGLALVGAADG